LARCEDGGKEEAYERCSRRGVINPYGQREEEKLRHESLSSPPTTPQQQGRYTWRRRGEEELSNSCDIKERDGGVGR
jgi:hypothetical protein